ncbi:MAG: RidA family protein [Comamonadaceae bacterium]|nr:MAG: RidA family protein [Comamonadaceae bacterium]
MTPATPADTEPARAHPFFSPVRLEGDLAFVSGQMPFDAQLRVIGDGVAEQTRVCLARIDEILKTEGLGLADVVKAMVWLRNVEDFAEFNRTYETVLRAHGERAPARSTVRADLMVPGALVEIEVIARRAAA